MKDNVKSSKGRGGDKKNHFRRRRQKEVESGPPDEEEEIQSLRERIEESAPAPGTQLSRLVSFHAIYCLI